MRDQDDADPHDLNFPRKHFPRASMVDNLAMSLDQFSSVADGANSHTLRSTSTRQKGHNKSSSITVSTEAGNRSPREASSVEIRSTRVTSKSQQDRPILPRSSEEEEEEDSQREKTYNAQRAMQSGKRISTRVDVRTKVRSDSNSSSIDLGHLASYAGRLGAAGNRRSQSFDFGSVRPKPLSDLSDMPSASVLYQSAEANVPQASAGATSQPVIRRNSGRSAKAHHSRKGRSGTIGAAGSRSRLDSPQPQLTVKSQTFDSAEGKTVVTTPTGQSPTPRAGFFRRVFGSSTKSNMGPSSYPVNLRQPQDQTGSTADIRRPGTPTTRGPKPPTSIDSPLNRESQPALNKKPSSFFRRRKKSVSGGVPPPLPLTLNNKLENAKVEAGVPSPVSSLRAFMDPYLGDGVGNTPRHVRGSSLQSVQHVDDMASVGKPGPSVEGNKINKSESDRSSVPQKQDLSEDPILPPPTTKVALLDTSNQTTTRGSPEISPASTSPTKLTSATLNSPFSADTVEPVSPILKAPNVVSEQHMTRNHVSKSLDETKTIKESFVKPRQGSLQPGQDVVVPSVKMIKLVPQSSGSDISDYKSAPSTPLVAEIPERKSSKSPAVHVSHPSLSQQLVNNDLQKARKIFDNVDEQINSSNACGWLGEATNERDCVRTAYMGLFNWTNLTILAALRNLCSKLILKGESQQVDRILDAFAQRWCQCNINHGFKSVDIVHTICYSILLLNTDLHLADIGRKMTRTEFVRNAMDTIRQNLPGSDVKPTESTNRLTVKTNSNANPMNSLRPSMDRAASALSNMRPSEHLQREDSYDDTYTGASKSLVETPFVGTQSSWELQVELVLKEFYLSISREPLPLFGSHSMSRPALNQSSNNLTTFQTLRRTPSTISKSTSDTRGRYGGETRSLGARWASKTRSRPRLGSTQAFGSSRTSFDDQSSAWSPSMSSTWSKVSLNKTLTSMSVESFGGEQAGGYQSSIGFANALSQAIIRDEQIDHQTDEGVKAVPLLEDESLELYGAPWAKEGILKHKCHLEGVDKRSKDRNWNDCFAVIEKGWMRLFSFSMTAKSLRNKARNHQAGTVVGGGNWQDNAEEIWKFMLRHTIASSLPPPGYSKQRPYVWALSLPNGAVHLFSVGTPDIVKEFVSTANFWSARLSKEPMTGGVSSMEYGWGDSVVNRSLIGSDSHPNFNSTTSPRPSTQLSMRSSMDHSTVRPRLPGDKIHISEWNPPQQSLMASQLLEVDQLKALHAYVKNIEDELQKHNELRGPMLLAFSTRHPNSQKAMANWEKKSSYLLREIVKFRTYIDALQSAQTTKERVDKMKKEEELSRIAESKATEPTAVIEE